MNGSTQRKPTTPTRAVTKHTPTATENTPVRSLTSGKLTSRRDRRHDNPGPVLTLIQTAGDHDLAIRRHKVTDQEWDTLQGSPPTRRRDILARMTGGRRTASCRRPLPVRHGGTSPSGTGHGSRPTPDSSVERWTAPAPACRRPRGRERMLPVTSTDRSRWIPPSRAHPGARPRTRQAGDRRSHPGRSPRRTDQQDPPNLRGNQPPARLPGHRREHQRPHPPTPAHTGRQHTPTLRPGRSSHPARPTR